MKDLEKAYSIAISMGIEKMDRQEQLICPREKNNENVLYNRDLLDIVECIRKDFTETNAYQFIRAFQVFDVDYN